MCCLLQLYTQGATKSTFSYSDISPRKSGIFLNAHCSAFCFSLFITGRWNGRNRCEPIYITNGIFLVLWSLLGRWDTSSQNFSIFLLRKTVAIAGWSIWTWIFALSVHYNFVGNLEISASFHLRQQFQRRSFSVLSEFRARSNPCSRTFPTCFEKASH